jgi:hypothetical protein
VVDVLVRHIEERDNGRRVMSYNVVEGDIGGDLVF